MQAMLVRGYRKPEFRMLIEGWADRMRRAADLLESEELATMSQFDTSSEVSPAGAGGDVPTFRHGHSS